MFPRSVIAMTSSLLFATVAMSGQPVAKGSVGSQQTASKNSISATAAVDARTVESRPWQYVVVHHSATEQGSVAAIDANHRSRRDSNGNPWRGIGYHFVIGNGHGMEDGQVSPTFRWKKQIEGAHAGSKMYNDVGIGICLIGNFELASPTAKQSAALSLLITRLRRDYELSSDDVIAHGDIRATACPGKLFPREQFLTAAHRVVHRIDSDRLIPEPSCESILPPDVLRTAETSSDRKDSR